MVGLLVSRLSNQFKHEEAGVSVGGDVVSVNLSTISSKQIAK